MASHNGFSARKWNIVAPILDAFYTLGYPEVRVVQGSGSMGWGQFHKPHWTKRNGEKVWETSSTILIRNDVPCGELVYTVAHELGHFVQFLNGNPIRYDWSVPHHARKAERVAYDFARDFLNNVVWDQPRMFPGWN